MSEKWFLFEKMYAIHPMHCIGYTRCPSTLEDDFKIECALFFKHRRLTMIYPGKRFADVGLAMIKKIKENPKWYKQINNSIRKEYAKWRNYCDELKTKDFAKFSNSELIDIYKEYYEVYSIPHGLGYYGNMIEFQHEYFTKFAKQLIENRIKKLNIQIDPNETFILLSIPLEESNYKKEEKDFKEIFLKIFDTETAEIFKDKDLEKLEKEDIEIYGLLKKHHEKYSWLPYMYEGPAWDLNFFFAKMKQMLEEQTPESLQKKEKKEKMIIKKRKSLLDNLNFDDYENEIIDLLQETIFLKGWRKDVFYHACYVITPYFEEVAKRLDLTLDQVRYFLPEELIKSLEKEKADKEMLKQRFEKSLYYIDLEGKESFFIGDEAEKRFNELYEADKLENVSELKGSCAYQGNVKGTVKVVNHASEIHKVEKGDILVSHCTNPNLVPAMERAGAIVTDVGGITCHAAIVSRELKIPCVVGTNIATAILKDGDKVEIDATNGIVRKI